MAGTVAPSGAGRHIPLYLAVVLCLQLAAWIGLYRQHESVLVDDAYISFRYAARWAEGSGLTWNDGVWVEGFSNPLWTLTLGGLAALGAAPHQAAPVLGLLSALATTVVVALTAQRRGMGRGTTLLVAGGIAFDLGFMLWAGSGLETAQTALLMAVLLGAATTPARGATRGILLGVLSSALALSRPEGGLWVLWTFAWLMWIAWAPGRVLFGYAAGLIPALGYLVFRLAAFGTLFPNTFFAKMEPSGRGLGAGLADLGGWTLAHALWVGVALIAGIRAVTGRKRTPDRAGPAPWCWLAAGFVLLQVLFVLAAGGDWMGRMRYLVPVLPAFYLLAAEGLRNLPVPRGRGAWVLAGLALMTHAGLGWMTRDAIPPYTREGRILAEWLRSTADSTDVVAVTAAGAIPYFSRLPAVDVLGINDPLVSRRPPRHAGVWAPGHHRYDLAHLLDLEPEWIVWDFGVRLNRHRWRTYQNWPPVQRGELDYRRELFAHPRFTARYELDTSAPKEVENTYTVYRKKNRRPATGGDLR